ncbi:MAG: sterol desaturase [[Chlorobium] sp. 445]|nr:MAG: sterol desaturase [[Chlorobium] sp. 445]
MSENALSQTVLIVSVLSGGALWLLEGIVPFFQNRQGRLQHALPNLAIALLNTALSSILMAGSLTALRYIYPYWQGLKALGIGDIPTSALIVLCYDFWMYLWHRLNHQLSFFWQFHRFHHADAAMDVTTGFRFHPLEILLSELIRLPVLALLGMGATEILLYNLLSFPVILLHHSNVALPASLENALAYLIPTPNLHRVHHSVKKVEADMNYGSLLSLWDRLFGTLLRHNNPSTLQLGIIEK